MTKQTRDAIHARNNPSVDTPTELVLRLLKLAQQKRIPPVWPGGKFILLAKSMLAGRRDDATMLSQSEAWDLVRTVEASKPARREQWPPSKRPTRASSSSRVRRGERVARAISV